ncbi:hypothetical protein A2V71_02980 [Candidatus Berkelbacteria bacterium RBG_13_40_8]|uniref:DUF5666 domain-containing protein n=1 Tax=Candidatus Berkelbacteria bacterium RBG_13_40_8 TaxID=1797467 RepID=A0A1F5DP37_9BACT|nr:MAG: hypothetical protein A2V71_02980 [Candidatus Berkelbacteria bacterium RBG_13_40_8]
MTYKQGLAPLAIVLIVTLCLAAGTATGYAFREPIQKAITGKSTDEELTEKLNQAETEKSKFELEGIATSVDATNSILTVKVKSSTDSIKELRLSEAPISVASSATIQSGDQKSLKIADIPIDSQVHVSGAISEGKLTATKILIQKENGLEKQGDNFALGGTVKEVGTDSLVLTVKTANAKVKDQKGKDVTIKVTDVTIIEKGDSVIALSDVKTDDDIQAIGVIVKEEYSATKIEVKIKEQAGTLEEEQENNAGEDSNIQNENQNQGQGAGSSNTGGNSSNSNSNKNE